MSVKITRRTGFFGVALRANIYLDEEVVVVAQCRRKRLGQRPSYRNGRTSKKSQSIEVER